MSGGRFRLGMGAGVKRLNETWHNANYGKPAPHVKGLRLQINSQHTGSAAESYFGEVEFRSAPQ